MWADFHFGLGWITFDALAVLAMPAGGIVDDRRITPLIAQSGEKAVESQPFPVLALGPGFERMVMTLSTIEPLPRNTRTCSDIVSLADSISPPSRSSAAGAVVTLGCDSLSRYLVVRLVLRDTVPEPFPVELGRFASPCAYEFTRRKSPKRNVQ